MDEKQTDNTISMDCSDNTTLPMTADLAKLSIDVNSSSAEPTTRVLRKRIVCAPKSTTSTDIRNRRCSLRPQKRKVSEMDIEEENIKKFYLNKKINKKINLETIYEETDNVGDDIQMRMSAKRFRRMLLFASTASKIKKRRAKIKKIFESKRWCRKNGTLVYMSCAENSKFIEGNGPVMVDKELLEKLEGQSSC